MKGIKDCANNSRTESLCPCEFVDVMYNECASAHVGGGACVNACAAYVRAHLCSLAQSIHLRIAQEVLRAKASA